MKLFKNREVVLMFAFGTLCAIVAVRPGIMANNAATEHMDTRAATPVVHVIGRRLTAEKRADASS
jgi:hypothetical protein